MMALLKEDWNKIGAKVAQYFQCCYYPTKMNRSYSSGAVAVRWEGNDQKFGLDCRRARTKMDQ
jgi:hypothetical protein